MRSAQKALSLLLCATALTVLPVHAAWSCGMTMPGASSSNSGASSSAGGAGVSDLGRGRSQRGGVDDANRGNLDDGPRGGRSSDNEGGAPDLTSPIANLGDTQDKDDAAQKAKRCAALQAQAKSLEFTRGDYDRTLATLEGYGPAYQDGLARAMEAAQRLNKSATWELDETLADAIARDRAMQNRPWLSDEERADWSRLKTLIALYGELKSTHYVDPSRHPDVIAAQADLARYQSQLASEREARAKADKDLEFVQDELKDCPSQ